MKKDKRFKVLELKDQEDYFNDFCDDLWVKEKEMSRE